MKIKVLILVLLLCVTAQAGVTYLGTKDSSETIRFKIDLPLDSAGLSITTIDTITIVCTHDLGTAKLYDYTATAAVGDTCTPIDSFNEGSLPVYYFEEEALTLDDTATSEYTMTIAITTWTHAIPSYTTGIVDISRYALGGVKVATDGIVGASIANNAIDSTDFANTYYLKIGTQTWATPTRSITAMGPGTIETGDIADGAITAAKLGGNAITNTKVADDVDINVKTVSNDAINLNTDICGTLPDSNVETITVDTTGLAQAAAQFTLAADSGVTERLVDSILDARGYSTLTLVQDSGITERLMDSILNARGYSTLTLAQDSGITERLIDSILDARGYSTFDASSDSVIVDGSALAATGGAIGATTIADDAIDYATFAATPPSAWWNEGKTGYALSTAGIDAILEYDTANISGAQAVGTMLKDTSAYQGAASGLTVAAIWNDSTAIDSAVAGFMVWLNKHLDSIFMDGDEMKMTIFNTPADTAFDAGSIGDSLSGNVKATGFAVAGDAMALTAAERGHTEDSIHAQAADYKSAGDTIQRNAAVAGNEMDLTDVVIGQIADTVWQNDTASMYAGGVGTIGDAIRDSAYSASGSDSATVYGAAYDALLDGLAQDSVTGTLEGRVVDSMLGTGSNPFYVYVLNYADSTAISGAYVTVDTKQDGTGSEYFDNTSGSGLAVFSMTTSDAILVSATAAPPYNLVKLDSVTITTSPQTDTLYMRGPTISAAGSPTMVTVWGQIEENGNAVRRARVEVDLIGPDSMIIDSTFVSYSRSDVTDTLGVWELPVYVNGQMNDTASYYEVREIYGEGLKRTYWFRCGAEDTATINVTNSSIRLQVEP